MTADVCPFCGDIIDVCDQKQSCEGWQMDDLPTFFWGRKKSD